jgi:uncharacterized membrane protein YebE (DUF533 family)
MTFEKLSRDERLVLIRFVCSFAWADFEIRNEERRFIADLVRKLELDPAERQLVEKWLTLPPEPESVDPALVPRPHRELFLAAIQAVISADGEVSPEERESLSILSQLVR